MAQMLASEATIDGVKAVAATDIEGIADKDFGIGILSVSRDICDTLGILLSVFVDRRIAVVGIAGGVERGRVEPADGLALPLILIAFQRFGMSLTL